MALINILPNGTTSGNPNLKGNKKPKKRQATGGWNWQVSRRLTKWFYSIPVESLTGEGIAFTLTVRDCPESSSDWAVLRDNLGKRLFRDGCIRLQWLTEWQERGVPHLHGVAYFEEEYGSDTLINHWLTLTTKAHGSALVAQDAKRITNVTGWLQYLAKHSTRSAIHYQRSPENIPIGWLTTGRMWGYMGNWEVREPMQFKVCQRGFYAFRRISLNLRKADVRERFLNARHAVLEHYQNNAVLQQRIFDCALTESQEKVFLKMSALKKSYFSVKREFIFSRRASKKSDPKKSFYTGTSNWMDQDSSIKIVNHLAFHGYQVGQEFD